MSDNLHTELAARMPWLHAQPDSIWEVTGKNPSGGNFTSCLARVLPPMVTGSNEPVFEVLIYAQLGYFVPASAITKARELLLVDAANPSAAYYERDQSSIDRLGDSLTYERPTPTHTPPRTEPGDERTQP